MLFYQWIRLFCVLRVCELFGETIRNMFGWGLLFCCWMWWTCDVWLEMLYWIDHVWASKRCVCCGCGPSERLDAPSMFVFVLVCQMLSLHFGVWELDHRRLVSLCCFIVWFYILCLRVRACNCSASLPFRRLCLPAISLMFVKIMLAVCILVGMVVWAISGLCVFCELCPVSFLVVSECPSILLQSVVMSYVDCRDDG